jgi:hypothetical protein
VSTQDTFRLAYLPVGSISPIYRISLYLILLSKRRGSAVTAPVVILETIGEPRVAPLVHIRETETSKMLVKTSARLVEGSQKFLTGRQDCCVISGYGLGCRVQGAGCRVQGAGCRVYCLGFRV